MPTTMLTTSIITPHLVEAIERVLMLACTARTAARTDEDLFRALDAIENASRVAVMTYLEKDNEPIDDSEIPY